MGLGEVCLGGLLVGLGLELVSVAGCWAAGLRLLVAPGTSAELCLGGLLDGHVSYALGPEAG